VTSIKTINAWERLDHAAARIKGASNVLHSQRVLATPHGTPLPTGTSAEERRKWVLSCINAAIDDINNAIEYVREMPIQDLPEFSEALKDLIRQEQNVTA